MDAIDTVACDSVHTHAITFGTTGGVVYAGMHLIVRRSFPGCEQAASESAGAAATASPAANDARAPPPPISDFMSQEVRAELRKVMDAAPSKRIGKPSYPLFANMDRYRELHSTAFHYEFHLLRHDCTRTLGRLCQPSDYPCPALLQFATCSTRPLRDAKARLPPPSVRDPDDARHHLSFEKVEALVASRNVHLYENRMPIGQCLKRWSKANGGLLTPSKLQLEALASQMLPPKPNQGSFDEMVRGVERWFEMKRMQRYLKAEAQQAALRDESTLVHARADAVLLLYCC
jgi:hypothetical protein